MKKLITLLLALAMVLSLTACGEQPTGATGDDGNTVSAESDGRTLYEAAIQLACDGDFPGSIEGLKKAVAAEETDDWTSWDIMTAWLRMAQIYRLQGDAEGEAQVKADYQAPPAKNCRSSTSTSSTAPHPPHTSRNLSSPTPATVFSSMARTAAP